MSEYIEKALADRELCDLVRKYNRACDSDASRGAFEALGYIRQLPVANVISKTPESALDFLREIGWLQQHDKELTAADVRTVVLCRDCKRCNKNKVNLPTIWCDMFRIAFPDDFYCGVGELKGETDMRNQEGDTP